MKKIIIILMTFIVTSITMNAQWNLQTNPLGTGQNAMLGKIQFVSATEGWIACGNNGSLLHTTDAGVSWNKITPFPTDTVGNMSDPGINMSWVNPTHGWILKTFGNFSSNMNNQNGAVLYGTADGGSTWSRKIFPKSASTISYNTADLQGVWQMHELVAANNTILSSWAGWLHSSLTLDANGNGNFSGMTKSSNITNFPTSISMSISSSGEIAVNGDFHGFMSADKNTAYITTSDGGGGYGLGIMQKVSSGVTYTTTDLQGTWQIHSLITANPSSSNQYSGWMYGTISFDASGNGTASFIKPNGTKTQNIAVAISTDGIVTMNGTDFYGFMNADKKSISITMTDGGSDGYDFMVMQKVNPSISYSSKDLQGVWQTHILTTFNSPTSNLNQLSGWKRGTITLNANGEGNVNLITNSNVKNENGISLSISSIGVITPSSSSELQINHLNGFINEDKSTIIMTITDDNGAYEIIVMQKDLSSSGDVGLQVQFTDANNGWVSVYNMIYGNFQLFKTSDGGSTWNPVTTNAGGFYQFVDANNGWMVGSSNVGGDNLNNIYHSTDGGTNWTLQASNIGIANALNFSDPTHGWVVGESGLVMKTTDGGTNWSAVTNTGQTTNSNSKCVFFLDANNGWIGSGYNNTEGVGTRFVLATKDGGASWTTQSTPVTNDIFSMFFWNAENGWFTSDYGQIAHYTYTPPKTVTISAGGLSGALSPTELSTTKNLAINGTIDARDFKTMRDDMPLLASVDLSGATITEYTGTAGTFYDNTVSTTYPANTIPQRSFYYTATKTGKTSLTSFIFPASVTDIGMYAFRSSGLTSITIPSTVTSIGYGNFYSCSNLIAVTIPASVKYIDIYAFGFCSALAEINIPSSVTSVGSAAFAWSGLSNITFSEGLLTIGDYAFQSCESLNSVNIPSSVTSVGYAAFASSGLRNITFSEGLLTIGDYAFQSCESLNSVNIPSSLTHIGYCAFTFDNALKSINVSASNSNYSSVDGVLYNKSQQKLLCYPGGKGSDFIIPSMVSVIDTAAFEGSNQIRNVVIPSSVTTLSPEAFYWCQGLQSIDIPSTVTFIGSYSFYNCISMQSISVHTAIPVDLSASDSVFNYINKYSCVLSIPSGSLAAYQAADKWNAFQNIKEVASKSVIITAGGLYGALNSNELNTTTNLMVSGTMDARDFKTMRDNMPMLANIDLSGTTVVAYSGLDGTSNSTTGTDYAANTLPVRAFYNSTSKAGKTSLVMFRFPSAITTIDKSAFMNCSQLNSIVIPSTVNTIGMYSFSGCVSLPSVNIPSSVTLIDYGAFYYCSGLSFVNLESPVSLKTIGTYAFGFCTNLNWFDVPASVTSIGEVVFLGSNINVNVDGNSVSYSSMNGALLNKNQTLMMYCPSNTSGYFQIPSTVKTIAVDAFYNCKQLNSISIPTGLVKIGEWAFENCTGLSSVVIPSSVDSIMSYAFYNCKNIKTIYAQRVVPVNLSASDSVFNYIDRSNCILYVPTGSKAAYQAADKWNDFVNITEKDPGTMIFPFIIDNQTHHLGDGEGSEGTSFKVIFNYPADPTDVFLTLTFVSPFGPNYQTPPTIKLNNQSLGSIQSFFPMDGFPNSGAWWQNGDGSSDYNGNFTVRLPIKSVLVKGENTFVIENGRTDDDYYFNNVQITDVSPGGGTTAADYYLPLKVGNYTKLHTIAIPSGWCDRSTKYSFIKSDNINGLQYLLEEGWEGDYLPGECVGANPVFRYEWLREDNAGNIMLGAISTGDQYGNLSPDINAAMILPTPMAIFPNKFLNVNEFISYQQSDTVMSIDSVISVNATAGSYTNCIQVRSLHRTKSGIVNFIEDSYYAYHVGLVMQNRILPISQTHTNYITDYVANDSTTNDALKPYNEVGNLQLYYIIGLGDGNWNTGSSGMGASYYPLSLVNGNQYDSNGNGTFTYTGYFYANREFKLIGGKRDWQEQWGNSGSKGINNPIHNYGYSANFKVPSDGPYTITLNTITNTLSIVSATVPEPPSYTTVGFIGEFNGWASDIPMTPTEANYNHLWYTTYTLTSDFTPPVGNGGCKFRANTNWTINWGSNTFPMGISSLSSTNIPYRAGTYIIFLNDYDGTYYFINMRDLTEINPLNDNVIRLYPNPVTDKLIIQTDKSIQSTELIDITGTIVKRFGNTKSISLSEIQPGAYLIKINCTDSQSYIKHIIKQ